MFANLFFALREIGVTNAVFMTVMCVHLDEMCRCDLDEMYVCDLDESISTRFLLPQRRIEVTSEA